MKVIYLPLQLLSFVLAAQAWMTPRRLQLRWTTTALHDVSFIGGLQDRLEQERRTMLVEASMGVQRDNLVDAELVGQARLPTTTQKNRTVACAVLLCAQGGGSDTEEAQPCLLVPLDESGTQLKLLEFAKYNQTQSKPVLLKLNQGLVNRDNALFDNTPWATWTVDPQLRNRDAAGNNIEAKFHLGKRDAYNRFLGKDWQGQSVAIGNLALRLKYQLENTKEKKKEDETTRTLMRRILELQLREQRSELAQAESDLAVCRREKQLLQETQENDDVADPVEFMEKQFRIQQRLEQLVAGQEECMEALETTQWRLQELESSAVEKASSASWTGAWLQEIADWTTKQGENAAPYRGAMDYAPKLDSLEDLEMAEGYHDYCSPYDLFNEIVRDQLQAQVIGCVLEQSSLLQGTLAVGGAVVLRRTTPTKQITAMGERLQVLDEEQDFGNDGITGGATYVVECDADEAMGLALACNVPIKVESSIWKRSSVMAAMSGTSKAPPPPTAVRQALPLFQTLDPELSILAEGQSSNGTTNTERVLPLRIPRTTMALWDRMFNTDEEEQPSSVFPTDNPIQSLRQYDSLDTQDKAKTLLELSNFQGRLPRPRVLRTSNPTALDDLLLPLIDEGVRRQYQIRDAERRGDMDEVNRLQQEASSRQLAKERAAVERARGNDDKAQYWDDEARLYSSLRADVTQDEGSYSRFLDRDEWYERQRAQQAKKIDKKKFGTLLDGIE